MIWLGGLPHVNILLKRENPLCYPFPLDDMRVGYQWGGGAYPEQPLKYPLNCHQNASLTW